MTINNFIRAVAVLVLTAPGMAMQDQGFRPVRSQGPVRHAGTYHLTSGTWTRSNSTIAPGADVIYNSTCIETLLFAGLEDGERLTDEGRIPSPSGPSTGWGARVGCASSYLVNGVEIGYCTDQPTVNCQLRFIESYTRCTDPDLYPALADFTANGLPGSSSGAGTCWTVTIDLAGDPDLSFTIAADGNGTYDPAGSTSGSRDLFGWSISFPGVAGNSTGPIACSDAENLGSCAGFAGTIWDPVVDLTEMGTGMSTSGDFFLEFPPPSQNTGCYFFNPAAFYLRLFSSANCPAPPGLPLCTGDGSATACPCGNQSQTSFQEGCRWHGNGIPDSSIGWGGLLFATGTASLSADTVLLLGTGMPLNSSVLYFQGTSAVNGGMGAVFGDGLRCAGGTIARLGTKTNSLAGTSQYPAASDPSVSVMGAVTAPGERFYQLWFRVSQTFCTPSTFNLTNGYRISWQL